MERDPLVSIVIPVYNGANFLRDAIDSALEQTYDNFEVIVVNDGSTDNGATEGIARSYGTRIRYFSKENGGVASALNFGIERMHGEYFSWLSHDDMYYADKVRSQIDFLKRLGSPNDVIPFSDHVFVDGSGKYLSTKTFEAVPPNQFPYFLLTDPGMHGCALLIPRRAFDECGMFPVDEPYTQDASLWLRMCGKFRFVHQDAILVKSRSHSGQDSRCARNAVELLKFRRREVERFFDGGMCEAFPDDLELQKRKSIDLVIALERESPGLVDEVVLRRLGVRTRVLLNRKLRRAVKTVIPAILVPGAEKISPCLARADGWLSKVLLVFRSCLPSCIGGMRLRS